MSDWTSERRAAGPDHVDAYGAQTQDIDAQAERWLAHAPSMLQAIAAMNIRRKEQAEKDGRDLREIILKNATLVDIIHKKEENLEDMRKLNRKQAERQVHNLLVHKTGWMMHFGGIQRQD